MANSDAPLVNAWLRVETSAAIEMRMLLIRLTSPNPGKLGRADILASRSIHGLIDELVLLNLRKAVASPDFF